LKKIILLFIILFSLNADAQYFDVEYSIEKTLQFKNKSANQAYEAFINGSQDIDLLLSKLNAIPTDSLKKNNDIVNFYLLNSIYELSKNKNNEAVLYALQAKKLTAISNNTLLQSNANLLLAMVNRKLNSHQKAIELLKQCNYDDNILMFQIEYLKAQNYFDISNYDKAVEILLANENAAKSISEFDYMKSLSLLVLSTSQNNDDALALNFALKYDTILNKATEVKSIQKLMNSNVKYFYEKSDNISSVLLLQKIVNTNNIGFLFRKLGDYENSKSYLLKSINYLKKYKNESMLPEIKTNIGLTYTHLKEFTEANINYQEALEAYAELKNTSKQAELYNIMAKNYFLEGKSILAMRNCNTAITITQANKDYANLANAYFILSEIYAINSDYQQSQAYFKLFTDTKNKTNKTNNDITQFRNQKENEANDLFVNAEEEIAIQEKKELELIKIKLESKQKEQELLLIKKDNEIKEKTIETQALEKEQALKSLELIKGQLEKEKLVKEYEFLNKEKEIKALENEKNLGRIKLLNSQKKVLFNEKAIKDLEIANDKKKQQYFKIGLILLSLFIVLMGYGFYENVKQKKVIEKANTQLKIVGENLQNTNLKLAESFDEINEQKLIIESKNNMVMDSISYSSKIQKSLLLKGKELDTYFNASMVIDLPRDIVGGDFYLVKTKCNKTFVAMVDCTGHGVPGSLISIIGYQEINHIINSESITPAEVLKKLNRNINKLVNTNQNSLGSDGMDVMLLEINKANNTLTFAGARSYLLIKKGDTFEEYKGDRISIGEDMNGDITFAETKISISEKDTIYLYTDGFQDQSSEVTNKRIGSKLLKQTIQEISNQNMETQKEKLMELLSKHQGTHKQTDDITLMAFMPKL